MDAISLEFVTWYRNVAITSGAGAKFEVNYSDSAGKLVDF